MSSEQACCSRRWQNTDFDKPKIFEDKERCVPKCNCKVDAMKTQIGGSYFWRVGKSPIPESSNFGTTWSFWRIWSAQSSVVVNSFISHGRFFKSVNYWLTKFVQEVAKPSKERYPPKTLLYQIACGLRRFMAENNEKLDFNPLEGSWRSFVAVCTCYYLFWNLNSLVSFRVIILCVTGSLCFDSFSKQK